MKKSRVWFNHLFRLKFEVFKFIYALYLDLKIEIIGVWLTPLRLKSKFERVSDFINKYFSVI